MHALHGTQANTSKLNMQQLIYKENQYLDGCNFNW